MHCIIHDILSYKVAIGKVDNWKIGDKPFGGHGSGMTSIVGGLGSGDTL